MADGGWTTVGNVKGNQKKAPAPNQNGPKKPKPKKAEDPPMSKHNQDLLRLWAKDCGEPDEILQRPSAESWPNTFVYMWKDPKIGELQVAYVALDVHYEGGDIEAGQPIKALGGMWMKSNPTVDGSVKPQQDNSFGVLMRPVVLDESPDPKGLEVFGKYKPKKF